MLFELSTFWLTVVLSVLVGGATVLGISIGRRARESQIDGLESATNALQATLLGFVGLLLAFGLSMAVGRYETRRATVVDEANAIGTTYLRAQTIPEPVRSQALALLEKYTDVRVSFAAAVPDSDAYDRAAEMSASIERRLWSGAGTALEADPSGSATRLYVDSLNEMIDMDTTRRGALSNRIPDPVMWLQILGASVALGVLGFHLALSGRSVAPTLVAAVVVILILFVTFDLDRPRRGFISVPDGPLTELLTQVSQPPAATPR